MRFMVMVKSDAASEAGVLPNEQLLSAVGDYNEQLIKAGVLLTGEGLQASSKGSRVEYANGKSRIVDGPFSEAKELLGGYWVMQVKSKEEAIEWAEKIPFDQGEVELRELYETEDFPVDPAEKPEGWRDQELAARAAGAPPRKPGTTRFALLLKADAFTEAGGAANEELLSEMGALMGELTASGAMLSGDGLKPSSKGARVRFSGKTRSVIDGPFTEAKELIAGFSVVQAESKAQATEWARRMLEIHVNGVGGSAGQAEVRQVSELSDFPVDPAEKPDGWRQKEASFRAN